VPAAVPPVRLRQVALPVAVEAPAFLGPLEWPVAAEAQPVAVLQQRKAPQRAVAAAVQALLRQQHMVRLRQRREPQRRAPYQTRPSFRRR